MNSYQKFKIVLFSSLVITCLLTLLISFPAFSGEHSIIQIKDFTQTEVKSGGFSLPSQMNVHIKALGGGNDKNFNFGNSQMYAYGWIINADTRELVWEMNRENTSRQKNDRVFDDDVLLSRGNYEVYFSAYAFISNSWSSTFNINIDRRKDTGLRDKQKKRGFFDWFEGFFGEDVDKEWSRRAKNWGIDISINDDKSRITTFSPPKEFPNVLYKAVQMGENEHIKQGFTISKTIPIRIYALGEIDADGKLADYGWIADGKTHKRIWEMKHGNIQQAGGAEKNVKFDDVISFSSGEYILYYNTDDSHSYLDWNAAPPSDPFNYGISLLAVEEKNKSEFKLSSIKENQNIIVGITRVGNNQARNESFTLKKESAVHIYAFGERSNSRRQMADYGWIVNAKTREKVWTMDAGRTEPAGGAEKNRMVDEVITLPKGTYTVFYQTDDSHAYNDWNASPPFDPEHWGITVSGEGDDFNLSSVEKNVSAKESGVIAQITQVGDNADEVRVFKVDKPTHIRIYALGEGQNREMNDYGWIENAKTGDIIWEMTYSMTFHAGGGRKNRIVNATILLDKGEYKLRYRSDDSHSFNDWNTDPPEDPSMWGITIYKDE